MSSLADITEQLKIQTKDQVEALNSVSHEVGDLSSNMKAFLAGMQTDKLKEREAELEKSNKVRSTETRTIKEKVKTGAPGGMFDFLQGGIGIGTGLSLIKTLGGYLLKYGLPAVLMNAFAADVAKYFEDQFNSEKIGDVVQGALKLGGLGLLLGKRFGLLGAVLGAVIGASMDEGQLRAFIQAMGIEIENLEVNIAHFMSGLEEFFKVTLPDMSEVFTYIAGAPVGALKAINGLLSGDYTEFFTNIDELATTILGLSLLFAPGKTFRLMSRAVAGLAAALVAMRATNVPGVPMTSTQNLPGVVTPDKDGMVTDKKGNKWKATSPQGKTIIEASRAKAQAAAAQAAGMNPTTASNVAKKFPRFGKLLGILNGIPGANLAINAGMLALILSDENTPADQKVKQGAGLFTGVAGSALGAALGSAIFPGLGTAVGGVGGYFLGDALGQYVMEWLMGKRNTDGIMEGIKKATAVDQSITTGEFDSPEFYGNTSAATNIGIPLEDAVANMNTRGYGSNTSVQDNSIRINNGGSTSQAIVMDGSPGIDFKDPYAGTRYS